MIKKMVLLAISILIFGLIYTFADRYLINPKLEFEDLDVVSKEVQFTKAIPFSLPDLDSQLVSLEQFKGKVIILNFWASWCGPCVEEFPSLLKLTKEFHPKVVLLAVSADESRDDLVAFVNDHQINGDGVQVLWDLKRDVIKKYGTSKLPETFVFKTNMDLYRKYAGGKNWLDPNTVTEIKKLIQ